MSYDVLILGAGLSGLAAGLRLAYFDKRVCILERHSVAGGLNSVYYRQGRKFDTGLHAITNYVEKGVKNTPLPRLLRQLRIKREEIRLYPQKNFSEIVFPQKKLTFTNDFEHFKQQVAENFPDQIDSFLKLNEYITGYNSLSLNIKPRSARKVVGEYISDPLLQDILFCPIMYYGSPGEDDIDFSQFAIIFQSIFQEGLARPREGMGELLDLMIEKYKNRGGELRLSSPVKTIRVKNKRVVSVVLETGEELTAKTVLSSIGLAETMRLRSDYDPQTDPYPPGKLSLFEIIYVLKRKPEEFGYRATMTYFYNRKGRFVYRCPEGLTDVSSGIICCPNNFRFDKSLPEGIIRVSHLANYSCWDRLSGPEEYREKKLLCERSSYEQVIKLMPEFRDDIVFQDIITPKTIFKFTGRINGTIYGTVNKVRNGDIGLENMFICGTDQGFPGIIGSMLSGVTIANVQVLMKDR